MDEAIVRYPENQRRSAAMPLLHLWQAHFGFISDEGINWIATKLLLEPINILELVTFYPMFRRENAGRTHFRVCRTLSCAMAGSYQLMNNLCSAAGISREHHSNGMHNPVSVSPDGSYSIEFVECLASCGTAPVCMVNDDLHENVDPNSVADLLHPQLSTLNSQPSTLNFSPMPRLTFEVAIPPDSARQHVVIVGDPQHGDPPQGAACEIEWPGDQLGDRVGELVMRERRDFDRRPRGAGLRDHLRGRAVLDDELRAQRLVARGERGERGGERGQVERAGELRDQRDVIRAGRRVEAPQEPLALLGERQRQRATAVGPRDLRRRIAGGCCDAPGERVEPGRVEHGAERHGDAELVPDPGHHACGEQRVAAEIEEAVGDTDIGKAEDIGPDPGELGLERGARCDARRAGSGGRGQCGAVELAVGGARQGGQDDQLRWDHRGGQHGRELPA